MKIRTIIEGAVLVAALAVFGVSAYKIYSYMDEAKKESQSVNTLSDNAVRIYVNDNMETNNDDNDNEETLKLQVDFDYLKNENEDIKAWLYSPDTSINYPIAQSEDNDYYLHRLTDKTYNLAGTLFIDYRNNPDFSDFVTIVYGHNMKNGTMFGTLDNYKNQEYYNEHPLMYLATPNQSYTLELIAGYVTDADSDAYIIPQTSDERDEFLKDVIKRSTFDSGISIDDVARDDRLVMLSTCSYEYENARFVAVGIIR
jgi:sortase B